MKSKLTSPPAAAAGREALALAAVTERKRCCNTMK
jgi:hypothetical protein